MTRNLRLPIIGMIAAVAIGAYALVAWSAPEDKTDPPAPVVAMADRGLEILGPFDAPGGLRGYAATFQGRPMAIYVTEDGQHAVLGTLVDENGNNLTAEPLERIASGPQNEKAWEQLGKATWIRDGKADAPRIVYEITDPNCPYCNQFWQTARPWVEAGEVQIRHVMVGILKADSVPKAATIVGADDPEAALERQERNYASGGIDIAEDIPDAARDKILDNNSLMEALGYFATPTILYRKANGDIGLKQGMPRGDDVEKILGPKP
ncbi:thiol:disulfide interchange protein DsbG [Salinisphaera sp. T31B1]|uniref:thiol:disulfide interchange protein DsbG n=1 Tax=Salinisphaera sp. T31B1 TaxID=727963 RepID=UPI003341AE8A